MKSVTNTGAYVSGGTYLGTYTSPYNSTPYTNLQALPGTNGTWLANSANLGYYQVTLYTKNACGVETTTSTYIQLNGPPSAATLNLQINNGITGIPCNSGSTATSPCPSGTSVTYNIGSPGSTFGSNFIDVYSRTVDEYFPSTSTFTNIYTESPIAAPNSGSATALSLNALVIGGSTGYFYNKVGHIYLLTIYAANVCSSVTQSVLFNIDGVYRMAQHGVGVEADEDGVTLQQNPVHNTAAFTISLKDNKTVHYSVYSITGARVAEGTLEGLNGDNPLTIDMSTAAPAMYYYHIGWEGSAAYSGKFIKE